MSELCDLMLYEHDGPCADPKHGEALNRRRATGSVRWQAIVRGEDGGGWRDFLDGRPIHCGEFVELQAVRVEGDDYGEYAIFLNEGTTVRYEANLSSSDGVIVLHASIGGHGFRTRHEAWMRFRWPKTA